MSSLCPPPRVAVSLFLSSLLVLPLCTPFAAAGHFLFPAKRSRSTQGQLPASYREGEILVRFRSGVSEKDKECERKARRP